MCTPMLFFTGSALLQEVTENYANPKTCFFHVLFKVHMATVSDLKCTRTVDMF